MGQVPRMLLGKRHYESQCQLEFPVLNFFTHSALLWKVGLGLEDGGCGEACGPRPAKDQATSPSWLLNS